MARGNYIRELRAAFFMPFMVVCMEGSIIGVLVKNGYEGVVSPGVLNLFVAIVAAAQAFASIVSFLWVRVSLGRDKVRTAVTVQVCTATLILGIAFAPRTPAGLVMLTALMIGARMCASGLVTLRAAIWQQNYPQRLRARITSKFMMIQVVMVALLGAGLGGAMRVREDAFRVMFPVGVLLATIAIFNWSKVRVRQRAFLARTERGDDSSTKPSFDPRGVWRVLAADRLFGAFMLCQLLMGLGNLMVMPVMVIVYRDQLGFGYWQSILLTSSIPLFVVPMVMPLWARLLDRVHVVRYRSIHTWIFAAVMVAYLVALLTDASWLLVVGSVLLGVAWGGGMLAWNLGHMDFAPPGKAEQYMGVHVTLTGVRGLIAPFLAVGVYEGLESVSEGSGVWVLGLCLVLCVSGAIGFILLDRHMRGGSPHQGKPIEVAPPSRAAVQ